MPTIEMGHFIKRGPKYFKRQTKKLAKKIRVRVKKQIGFLDRPVIMAYKAYGNHDFFHLQGHVIEDRGMRPPSPDDSIWTNAKATIKRFVTETFPEFYLKIEINGNTYEVCSNNDGYFEAYIPNQGFVEGWHPLKIAPSDSYYDIENTPAVNTELFISTESKLGVISDIDDTFLISHSTKQLRKIRLMMFKNAHTRKQFEGVSHFYNSLYSEPETQAKRPIFFVSSSEWNLYDFLVDFCQAAGMPPAILLLQDMKISFKDLRNSGGGSHSHKLDKIQSILLTYPHKKFILIGDSGQKDPDLYLQAAREFPEQIEVIYIRDVRKSRRKNLKGYQELFSSLGIPMVFFQHTAEAEAHARQAGFID